MTSLVFCPVLTEFLVLPSDKQPGVVWQEPPERIGHNKKRRIKGQSRPSQVRDPQRRPFSHTTICSLLRNDSHFSFVMNSLTH